MCMHGINRDAYVRQSSYWGCESVMPATASLAISAFALARLGLKCAALMGIGASTKANDAICEYFRHPDWRRRGAVNH